MKYLTTKLSLKLFDVHAFPNHQNHPPLEEMKSISKCITQKCGRLRLAIKTITTSLARVERVPNMWKCTLQRLNQVEVLNGTIMPSLRLIYYALPYYLNSCFLYCYVFPKHTEMRAQCLIYEWICQAFISNDFFSLYQLLHLKRFIWPSISTTGTSLVNHLPWSPLDYNLLT